MSVPDDTLDIQPVLPVGATPWTPDFAFGDGILNPGGDKNPEAAARARAMLAAAHTPPAPNTFPAEAPFEPVQIADKPVSPAHTHATGGRPQVKKHISNLRPILNAVGVFLILVLIFKAPVIYSQVKFMITKPAADTAVTTEVPSAKPVAVSGESMLIIPKINVKAPIIFEPSIDEIKVDKALEHGVVHYGISANFGEVGNTVITGHSSNDWWQPGNYKFVFVLLGKLEPGDQILANYQGIQYKYEVTERRVVEATDVSVVSPTGTPTLTLITCWPAGTNLKREVVRAKQVSPELTPGSIKIAQTPSSKGFVLPGSSRTLTQQVGDFWHSITGAFSQKPTEVKSN